MMMKIFTRQDKINPTCKTLETNLSSLRISRLIICLVHMRTLVRMHLGELLSKWIAKRKLRWKI